MQEKIVIDIVPVPKPRMTRSDKWKKRKCVVNYFKFKDEINRHLKASDIHYNGVLKAIDFIIPMPQSWSKAKKIEMEGEYHRQKPDLDNLLKCIKDCILKDDSIIYEYVSIRKYWGKTGKIIIYQ